MRPIPIGIHDFRLLREQGLEYVDKSHLVREVIDQGAQVLLLPRPRRFGKTLNLSMLRYFFEKRGEDLSGLFADLAIWQAGGAYQAHFRRYPVVFLTFKDVKAERWENVALDDLGKRESALWSLHVLAGYLKAEPADGPPGEVPPYRLSIPNREVREVYTSTFQDWLAQRLGDTGGVAELTRALLEGDAEVLEEQLQAFTTSLLSYHDTRLRPEQVYHAFVIGLLATLESDYLVRSNRESGTGRPDVVILPKRPGRPGVHAFAVAFDGKRVSVRSAEA